MPQNDTPTHPADVLERYTRLLKAAIAKVLNEQTDPLGRVSLPRTELELHLSLAFSEAMLDYLAERKMVWEREQRERNVR